MRESSYIGKISHEIFYKGENNAENRRKGGGEGIFGDFGCSPGQHYYQVDAIKIRSLIEKPWGKKVN